ncbi:hypothetical protein C7450_101798 [Chelatococcus asaccharovorans]|uniref:Uncharacterized protein n=1 Tax=Chelatococcus asaccharovorans TaxID=28210 RepID=A0A2V3UJM0_9HYPH|nr:hypothetical protein C7450_101798 [Chelatococcus asaccharovorans]
MGRRAIYTGSEFGKLAGHAPALVDGDRILVSGTAGHDPAYGVFPPSGDDQRRREPGAIASKEAGR